MQAIANLMALTAETDITKRTSPQVTVYPERIYSLVNATELSGACEHAAAVDPDRHAESLVVFQGKIF